MKDFTDLDVVRAKSAIAMFKKASFSNLQFGECVAVTQTMIWLESIVLNGQQELKEAKEKAEIAAALSSAKPVEMPPVAQVTDPIHSVTKQKKKK